MKSIMDRLEKSYGTPELKELFKRWRRRLISEIKLGRIENPYDEPFDINRT